MKKVPNVKEFRSSDRHVIKLVYCISLQFVKGSNPYGGDAAGKKSLLAEICSIGIVRKRICAVESFRQGWQINYFQKALATKIIYHATLCIHGTDTPSQKGLGFISAPLRRIVHWTDTPTHGSQACISAPVGVVKEEIVHNFK